MGEIMEELLLVYQVVVFIDIILEKVVKIDDFCYKQELVIVFIKVDIRGLFGFVFCDFGLFFIVVDVDGEEFYMGIIVFISNDNFVLVICVDDERVELQDGDFVVFFEVYGMLEFNDGKFWCVKGIRLYLFLLDEDMIGYGVYEKGGIVMQVKFLKVFKFQFLREVLENLGEFLLSDFVKFDCFLLLYVVFQVLDVFCVEVG